MQGLADGYFVIPYTIGDYLASSTLPKVTTEHDAFREEASANSQNHHQQVCSPSKGRRGIRELHRELRPHHVGTTSAWRRTRGQPSKVH